MNYLVDTNIFLEILLGQDKKEHCKQYLNSRVGSLFISDFSLHSIGVILFRTKNASTFGDFLNDILPGIEVVSLPEKNLNQVIEIASKYHLDFDDAYQATISEHFDLSITTMDSDFTRLPGEFGVNFISN